VRTGKVATVRYEAVNVMLLLNEFLKAPTSRGTASWTRGNEVGCLKTRRSTHCRAQVSERVELSAPAPQLGEAATARGCSVLPRGLVAGRSDAPGLTVCTPPMSIT
jgi:hypothetical protein